MGHQSVYMRESRVPRAAAGRARARFSHCFVLVTLCVTRFDLDLVGSFSIEFRWTITPDPINSCIFSYTSHPTHLGNIVDSRLRDDS